MPNGQAGGAECTIVREEIRSLQTLGVSTMPDGLEGDIGKQGMVDLLAFYKRVTTN